MKIEFDPAKSEWNIRERGLPFELIEQFDWESAVLTEDARFDYPEGAVRGDGLHWKAVACALLHADLRRCKGH